MRKDKRISSWTGSNVHSEISQFVCMRENVMNFLRQHTHLFYAWSHPNENFIICSLSIFFCKSLKIKIIWRINLKNCKTLKLSHFKISSFRKFSSRAIFNSKMNRFKNKFCKWIKFKRFSFVFSFFTLKRD